MLVHVFFYDVRVAQSLVFCVELCISLFDLSVFWSLFMEVSIYQTRKMSGHVFVFLSIFLFYFGTVQSFRTTGLTIRMLFINSTRNNGQIKQINKQEYKKV